MINVCHNCGAYHADKIIDPAGPEAICPACGYRQPFLRLPLLIVCGPSCAGKSAVCQALLGTMPEVVILEGDLLWRHEFDCPHDGYREFFETWLRLCKNIAQSGRPVVLFNAGAIPRNVEPCVERRYVSVVHYLALVCDDSMLVERLRARPAWRRSGEPEFVQGQVQFNRWLKDNANRSEPCIDLFDTTSTPVEQTAAQVAAWIRTRLASGLS